MSRFIHSDKRSIQKLYKLVLQNSFHISSPSRKASNKATIEWIYQNEKQYLQKTGVFGEHEINQGCGENKSLWKIIFSCTFKKPLQGQMFAAVLWSCICMHDQRIKFVAWTYHPSCCHIMTQHGPSLQLFHAQQQLQ
jgi:hypothetical protein